MRFETPDGRLFTLNVERYEFPDGELGPTEDNPPEGFDTGRFLIVSHVFRNADGEWTTQGPTMDTIELQRLADWLEDLRDDKVGADGVYFTERDLELTVDRSRAVILVHASFGFRPSWSKETVAIEFPIASIALARALESLRCQLARFPGRPPIDRGTSREAAE